MLMLSRNVIGALVWAAAVVVSAQIRDSDSRTNVIGIGAESFNDDDVIYEADLTFQARDKRTIGTLLRGVGDLFGYDVQRRPSLLPLQTAPAAAAAPAATANAPAGPVLAQQMAPPAPPPGAPAPAPAAPAPAPVTPPITLTDGVRRAFQLGVNWSNQRQQLGPPPAPAGPPPAAAPAPAPAPAAAAPPPVQGERRSYTVGLNWQNLRQQLGGPPAPAAPAPAPAPAPAAPPGPQGFRQSYQVGFDFSNQRQQLGAPPPAPAAPAPPPPAPPAGRSANLDAGAEPALVERIYFNNGISPPVKQLYYPKVIEKHHVLTTPLPLQKEDIDERPPVHLDTPTREAAEPESEQEEEEDEEEEEQNKPAENETDDRDDSEEVQKKEPPRGFKKAPPLPPAGSWRKQETADSNKEAYVYEEDYAYGDKPKKVPIELPDYSDPSNEKKRNVPKIVAAKPRKFKKYQSHTSVTPEHFNPTPLTLLQMLSSDVPTEIKKLNSGFTPQVHHRPEEAQTEAPAAEKVKVEEVTKATPVQKSIQNVGDDHGKVHREHQSILKKLVNNFENQKEVALTNKYPSAPGLNKKEDINVYFSKALDGIVKNFEKNARRELVRDTVLIDEHQKMLAALKEIAKQDSRARQNREKLQQIQKQHEENEPIKSTGIKEDDEIKEKVEAKLREDTGAEPEDTTEKEEDDDDDDGRVKVGNEDIVGPNDEYENAKLELKQEGPNNEFKYITPDYKEDPKQEFEHIKTNLKPETESETIQPKLENEDEQQKFDSSYFFKPTEFIKHLEEIIYPEYNELKEEDEDDESKLTESEASKEEEKQLNDKNIDFFETKWKDFDLKQAPKKEEIEESQKQETEDEEEEQENDEENESGRSDDNKNIDFFETKWKDFDFKQEPKKEEIEDESQKQEEEENNEESKKLEENEPSQSDDNRNIDFLEGKWKDSDSKQEPKIEEIEEESQKQENKDAEENNEEDKKLEENEPGQSDDNKNNNFSEAKWKDFDFKREPKKEEIEEESQKQEIKNAEENNEEDKKLEENDPSQSDDNKNVDFLETIWKDSDFKQEPKKEDEEEEEKENDEESKKLEESESDDNKDISFFEAKWKDFDFKREPKKEEIKENEEEESKKFEENNPEYSKDNKKIEDFYFKPGPKKEKLQESQKKENEANNNSDYLNEIKKKDFFEAKWKDFDFKREPKKEEIQESQNKENEEEESKKLEENKPEHSKDTFFETQPKELEKEENEEDEEEKLEENESDQSKNDKKIEDFYFKPGPKKEELQESQKKENEANNNYLNEIKKKEFFEAKWKELDIKPPEPQESQKAEEEKQPAQSDGNNKKNVFFEGDEVKKSEEPEKNAVKAEEEVSEPEEEEDDEEEDEEQTNAKDESEEQKKAADEEEKRRIQEQNEKELKEYINKHFEVDVIDGIAVPKGVKDTERYKQIVKHVSEPIDNFFAPKDFGFREIDDFFGQSNKEEDDNDNEELDEEEEEESEIDEVKTKPRDEHINPESQDTKTHEVIQSYLHTGGFKSGTVQALDNPEKVLSVPFDYDYSSSETQVAVEASPKNKQPLARARREAFPEFDWTYEPESYDPYGPMYEVPKQNIQIPDLSKLKIKEDQEIPTGPNAFVTETQTGRKKTYIRVNQRQRAMVG